MASPSQIAALATISGAAWKSVAVRMSWFYRTGIRDHIPEIVSAAFSDDIPTQAEWMEIRVAVTLTRKLTGRMAKRAVKVNNVTKRRRYMRDYMISYRKRGKEPVSTD